jgi:putative resolvase
LPVAVEQTATGTILIKEQVCQSDQVAVYARVSSSDQKNDLDRQVSRLVMFANSQKWVVAETIMEIGSALNDRRPKLKKMLSNSSIKIILVEHPDRLMRFGIEYIEALLSAQGRKLVIVETGELKDDLAQDMIEVLTLFCARLYGRRSARNRAKRAMDSIENES